MPKISTTFGDLALLPFPAEAPVKETLEFLTDVIESHDGSEQRLQLRDKARQTINYSVPLRTTYTPSAINTVHGAMSDKWAVPLWNESQFVGNVVQGATSVDCDTTHFDLRDDSLAMLFADWLNWQIVELTAVEASYVSFASVLGLNNAYLVPVRVGWIQGDAKNNTNCNNGKLNLTFEIEDNLLYAPSAPEQYLSKDVYYEIPLLSGDAFENRFQKKIETFDEDLGPKYRYSPWLYSKYSRPYFVSTNVRSKIKAYRDFIYRRAGKFREFYYPSHEVNLRLLNTSTITTQITISSDSFVNYASDRQSVAFEKNDGTWVKCAISNPQVIDANTITLDLSANLNLNPADVIRVSYLSVYRLEADKIEINWNTNGIMESEIRILEIRP